MWLLGVLVGGLEPAPGSTAGRHGRRLWHVGDLLSQSAGNDAAPGSSTKGGKLLIYPAVDGPVGTTTSENL